jgi:membrane protein implicated in regulation of membrane protease activity
VIWFLIGLFFLLLELVIPGLIVFFFGIGAWLTSLFLVLFDPGLNVQLTIFVVTSVLGLFLLRKFLKNKFFSATNVEAEALEEEFIGKTAIAEIEFKKGVPGKINFKGTHWTAIADSDLEPGDQVKIINKESLTLYISKKH